jgi:hypothetical protein
MAESQVRSDQGKEERDLEHGVLLPVPAYP